MLVLAPQCFLPHSLGFRDGSLGDSVPGVKSVKSVFDVNL